MVSIAAKLAELIIATIPALVVKLVLGLLRLLGQKLTRAVMELVGLGIYYTGGWLLWVIWVLAVWFGWTLLPKVQAVLPAAADVWATGLLFVMAGGLALWTTRKRRWAMRQRRMQRQLLQAVGGVSNRLDSFRGELVQGVARRARGTVAEGVFQSNRAKRAEEQAAAEATAERAERERAAAAEWDQAVAAKRAERERFAAAAAERWTNRQREGA